MCIRDRRGAARNSSAGAAQRVSRAKLRRRDTGIEARCPEQRPAPHRRRRRPLRGAAQLSLIHI
eukprot:6768366-Alexandrium_andersonii.AAC.1